MAISSRSALINSISNGAGYVVPMLLNFVTVPVIISHLGEEAFGIQALVVAILSYLMLADVGLDIPIVKFAAQFDAKGERRQLRDLLSTTFWMYLAIGVLMSILLLLFAKQLAFNVFQVNEGLVNDAYVVFQWTAFGFVALMVNMWGQSYLKGLHRYSRSNLIAIGMRTVGALVGLVLVLLGHGIVAFMAARILSYFLGTFLFVFAIWQCTNLVPWASKPAGYIFHLIKGHLGYGLLLRITTAVITRLDQVLLGAWVSVSVAGLYAVPVLVSTSVSSLIGSLVHFAFPMSSALVSQQKHEELGRWFVQVSKGVVVISFVLFVPLIALAKPILTLWVDAELATKTYRILWIVGFATLINSATTTTVVNFMVGIGRIREFTLYAVVRAVVIGGGMLLFIPEHGMMGAAVALTLSVPLEIIFLALSTKKYIGVGVTALFIKVYMWPALTGGLAAFGLHLLAHLMESWWQLLTAGGLFAGVFLSILWAFGYWNRSEKGQIRALLRK